MSDVPAAVASVRGSVGALLRISPGGVEGRFEIAIVGTAWCVSANSAFVTAFHVLNNLKPRDPAHDYYVLRAPGNGQVLEHWPVTGFPLEDASRDLAVLVAPVPANAGFTVPAIPVALSAPADGTRVLTYGCPAPAITEVRTSADGKLLGISTVLFAHANTGIVAAQYPATPLPDTLFEFSVGWHHGESGGPVIRLAPEVAAFAVMQHYRNIQGPHGMMAGPRRGLALASIRSVLAEVGATFV